MTSPTSAPAGGAGDEVRYFFIRRPVLAVVISVIITLLGVFAIRLLPISRYPQITPPAVQVQATFPGATAEDVAEAVAAPIEAQLSGLQGLLYYSSANASDGTMSLQIYFDVSRSQDLAAVDVQNAVKLAEPQLPDAVRQNGITILKANTDILGVVALTSDDPQYDAAYLTNYMKLYVEDEIKRVPGIGNALTFGGLEFSMRIQLDPGRMAQLGITTGDVADAVREQNATSPAGHWTWGSLVDALGNDANAPAPAWVDEALLLEQKVEPWTGLPLWIPSTFADEAGFMEFDCRRALAAGLRIRPLAETIDATAAWLAARDNGGAWKAVLTAEAERAILAFATRGVISAP